MLFRMRKFVLVVEHGNPLQGNEVRDYIHFPAADRLGVMLITTSPL